ncbi:MAG: hypothetical protein ACD_67C00056G0007 [uncultured bacterium]|nr:MAG: hypothetical protein ACD_67C00056G0007 [uncultured bacterium]
MYIFATLIVIVLFVGGAYSYAKKQSLRNKQMTFFLTSINPGKGADLGGLAGADSYCQALATSAGAGEKTWHAYLSTTSAGGNAGINARDRIGQGPWKNFKGEIIAKNIEELHGENNINKQTALTEKGQVVNGRGDTPNIHDILTGSGPDGRTIAGDTDTTCGNWTKNTDGSAMVGHQDRMGTSDTAEARSWNSSHLSRGCDLEALASSGGRGLFYCFATN